MYHENKMAVRLNHSWCVWRPDHLLTGDTNKARLEHPMLVGAINTRSVQFQGFKVSVACRLASGKLVRTDRTT